MDILIFTIRCLCSQCTQVYPVTCMILGVNTPDHSLLYSNLICNIKSNVTPYVVHLKPKTTSSFTLRHIMQSIASQLNECVEVSEEFILPTAHCTLSQIEAWYTRLKSSSKETSSPSVSKNYLGIVLAFPYNYIFILPLTELCGP